MNVPADKTVYPGIDESGQGPNVNLKIHINKNVDGCFKINVSQAPEIKDQAEIVIVSSNELTLKIKKNASAAAQSEINSVAEYLGHSPFGLKFFSPTSLTLQKYQTIQVTLFYNKKTLSRDDQVNVQRQRSNLRATI